MCQQCKAAYDTNTRKPMALLCGDKLCEPCYDSCLLEDGKRIQCPFNKAHLVSARFRTYDEDLLKKIEQSQDPNANLKIPIKCDVHPEKFANCMSGMQICCKECFKGGDKAPSITLGVEEYQALCVVLFGKVEEIITEMTALRSKLALAKKSLVGSLSSSDFIGTVLKPSVDVI